MKPLLAILTLFALTGTGRAQVIINQPIFNNGSGSIVMQQSVYYHPVVQQPVQTGYYYPVYPVYYYYPAADYYIYPGWTSATADWMQRHSGSNSGRRPGPQE